MARLLSPDQGCVAVDAPSGLRYKGRILDVTNRADERAMREVGYTVASVAGAPAKRAARHCVVCGFKGWFTTCGRCGGDCERES